MAIRDYGADRTRRLKVRIGAKLGAPGDGEVVIEQRARSQAEFLPASDVRWTKYRKVAARQAKRMVAVLNRSRHWMTRLFEHRIRPAREGIRPHPGPLPQEREQVGDIGRKDVS